MAKTKFFRVAVEGETATDGRVITREMINEAVANYNFATYGARINMEHLRGYSPEAPFNAYGDVLALKAENYTLQLDGKDESRLALYAELDPTAQLIEVNRKRQKVYTSVELQPNFAGTGKYGLVGLAVTDSPASLGCELLKFSAKADDAAATAVKADLDRRKLKPDNLFSAAHETAFEMAEDDSAAAPSALDKFAALIVEKFGRKEEPVMPKTPPADAAGPDIAGLFTNLTTALAADRKADQEATAAAFAKLTSEVTGLKADLDKTPKHNVQRPATPGGQGAGVVLTDC